MRRRKDELEFWLFDSGRPEGFKFTFWLRKMILERFRLQVIKPLVREHALYIDADTGVSDGDLGISLRWHDGLSLLGQPAYCPADNSEQISLSIETCSIIKQADLLGVAACCSLSIPCEDEVHIKHHALMIEPRHRSLLVSFKAAKVRPLNCLQIPEVRNGSRYLSAPNPKVHALISCIAKLPHIRTSMNLNRLSAAERVAFLREAEVLKEIPVNRSELIAVFRHVPIELISKLRFLDKERVILFSLINQSGQTRTRVHDLAAIRDKSNQEIHLVAHRTRYQMVSLN